MNVNPQNLQKVTLPKKGEFAVPSYRDSKNLQDSPRLRRSIKGMKTLLSNLGYKNIANYIGEVDDSTLPKQLEDLHHEILNKIDSYQKNPSDSSLVEIFHLIQFWGGVGGRSVYVRGKRFPKNFNIVAYKDIILESARFNKDSLDRIISSAHQIHGLGISFVTKHMRFWAEASGLGLPIYDKLMAQSCFGFNSPRWSHYLEYFNKMHDVAQKMELTVNELERRIFCFVDSEDGGKWIKNRTRKYT